MTKRKEQYNEISELTLRVPFQVRFSETDALGIVWHGNYLLYFEDAREAFGSAHGISYIDVKRNGYSTPIVASSCKHKKTLKYGDSGYIEVIYIDTPSAKMMFRFNVFNQNDELVCTGATTQVFVNSEGNLAWNLPAFYEEWKHKVGLLK